MRLKIGCSSFMNLHDLIIGAVAAAKSSARLARLKTLATSRTTDFTATFK